MQTVQYLLWSFFYCFFWTSNINAILPPHYGETINVSQNARDTRRPMVLFSCHHSTDDVTLNCKLSQLKSSVCKLKCFRPLSQMINYSFYLVTTCIVMFRFFHTKTQSVTSIFAQFLAFFKHIVSVFMRYFPVIEFKSLP